MVGVGLNAEITWIIKLTEFAASSSNRKVMLEIMASEVLKTIVISIRHDESFILAVKGDAPRIGELAWS